MTAKQQTQTFAAIDDAIAYITHEPQATFTVYALRNVYDAIANQVFEQENREDYESLWGYRMKKMTIRHCSTKPEISRNCFPNIYCVISPEISFLCTEYPKSE